LLYITVLCTVHTCFDARLGCNWLQASLGCKDSGGSLAELPDPEVEQKLLSAFDEKVNIFRQNQM
jgi:hypothetical protein